MKTEEEVNLRAVVEIDFQEMVPKNSVLRESGQNDF